MSKDQLLHGQAHVGATSHSLQRLFPAVLNQFRRVLPGVDIRLTEGHSAMLLDRIRTGVLHLAFSTYQPELRKASRLVGVAPLLAIGHGERRRQGDTIEVRAPEDIPLLPLQRGFGTRELFEAACHVAHIRPNIFLESDAPATLPSLAEAGCGIAILPATVRLRGGGLTIQKIVQDDVPLEFRVAVHWGPQRFLRSASRRGYPRTQRRNKRASPDQMKRGTRPQLR